VETPLPSLTADPVDAVAGRGTVCGGKGAFVEPALAVESHCGIALWNRDVESRCGTVPGVEPLCQARITVVMLQHDCYTGRCTHAHAGLRPRRGLGFGRNRRATSMLQSADDNCKSSPTDSPLSVVEIRRILREAANPCYWVSGANLWKRFHADRDALPDHAEVYFRAATQHCAKFYTARHDLLGRISPATWAALPLDGVPWETIDPHAAARACAAALAELVCAEAASHSAPPPTAPPPPSTPTATTTSTPTADSGPAATPPAVDEKATPALTPTERQVLRLYVEAVVALAGTDPQELPTVRAAYDWLIANGEYDGEFGAFRKALARARRKTDDRPVDRVPRSAVPKSNFYGR